MLKKLNRLKHRREIKFIFRRGSVASSQYLTLRYHPNRTQNSRIVIVISTKVAKSAVRRNRLRRRLQGLIKQYLNSFKAGSDLILIVKKDFYQLTPHQLKQELEDCFRPTSLLSP